MSAGSYLIGVAFLALMVVPIAVGAVCLRQRLLKAWSGPPARLAESVLALTMLIGVGMLLGSFGEFRRTPVAVACLILGSGAAVVARGSPARTGRSSAQDESPPAAPIGPPSARIMLLLAAAAAVLLLAQWTPHIASSYQRGMLDGDTVWYHGPFAARFVQTGWVTRLLFTHFEPLVTFFPANGELFAGLAILPFHHDILLPVINLAWLALALLAGWSTGRPYGAGPVGLVAVAAVMSLPVMASTQAGTLRNDVIAIALFMSAVALVVNAGRQRAALVLAGLAAGLAVGTKVDLVIPVLALLVGTVLVASRRRQGRIATVAPCLGAAVVVGSFWYVRNLVRTGNPLPWYGLHLGPISLPAAPLPTAAVGHTAVVNHLADHGIWGGVFLPGLKTAFGLAWPVLLLVAAVGAVLATVEPGSSLRRMLSVVAIVTAVAYLFTPNTVPGTTGLYATNFALNLRYLTPALTLAVALLAASPLLAVGARRLWVLGVLVGIVAVDQVPGGLLRDPEWRVTGGEIGLGIASAAVVVVALAIVATSPRRSPLNATTAAAAVALIAVGVGFPLERSYLHNRYLRPNVGTPVSTAYPWARGVEHQRIALAGDYFQYPFYGSGLSNWVQFVGDNGPHGAFEPTSSCRQWRDKLSEGQYRYVVIAPALFHNTQPRELGWTRSDPAATAVVDSAAHVFELGETQGPYGCT